MLWVAPSERDTITNTLEKRVWDAADQLRANSGLTSARYSTPHMVCRRFIRTRTSRQTLTSTSSCIFRKAPNARKATEEMREIEKHNPQLAGVLPKTYSICS